MKHASQSTVNPEFVEMAKDSTLGRFLDHRMEDERYKQNGPRHFITMLRALSEHRETLPRLAAFAGTPEIMHDAQMQGATKEYRRI